MGAKEEFVNNSGEQLINVLPGLDLSIDNIGISGDGFTMIVSDPAMNDGRGGKKRGEYWGTLPKDVVRSIPGSVVSPIDFLKRLGVESVKTAIEKDKLLGNDLSESGPILEGGDEWTKVKVFHGSTTEKALRLIELAKDGFDKPLARGEYQEHVSTIMKPVLEVESDADLRIIEDCIASGETALGLIAAMHQKGWDLSGKTIRLDVAVATAQGVLLLQEFAKQNELSLEINVGHMAFGLSKGEQKGDAKLHANYITWPENLLLQLPEKTRERLRSSAFSDEDSNIYVVGDMGDAGKSLPKEDYDWMCSWNKYRNDSHGDRESDVERPMSEAINRDESVVVFLTNGGYWMEAVAKHFDVLSEKMQVALFSAKRIWSLDEKFGYGVLFANAPEGFFEEQKSWSIYYIWKMIVQKLSLKSR